MNRKWLLTIIISVTIIAILIILIFSITSRYNKLITNSSKWDKILSEKTLSNSIKLESISFNDYNLLIDEENSIIYYSVIESSNKYNPTVSYKANDNSVKVLINSEITDEKIDQADNLKIMIYNDNNYRIYNLVVTKLPLLNINYKDKTTEKENNIPVDLTLFDNHVDAIKRIIKSEGKFSIIESKKEYKLSLIMESLGHNKRENPISIFGMERHNTYILKESLDNNDKLVHLFINNKYIGVYSLGHNQNKIK